MLWYKGFRINPEFWILRIFSIESQNDKIMLIIIWFPELCFPFLRTFVHLNLKLFIFIDIAQVLGIEFYYSGFLKYFTFTFSHE